MPKGKDLNKIYKFQQEELEIVPKKKCLSKKS
jgi:hypothetical protein